MTYVLIIMMHVGLLGRGNSNALTNVPGFKTLKSCEDAGKKIEPLSDNTVKVIKTICVEQ